MFYQLIGVAVGVIVGLPIALYGFMRLDEQPGRLSWLILGFGLLVTLGPVASAAISQYERAGTGRYAGR